MAEPLQPWRVVVIEDDAATRAYLSHSVRHCAGTELAAEFEMIEPASRWLASNPVDLLLTDLALPDGHALPLIRRLKEQQRHCEIVVVSVFGDEDTVFACIQAGAIGYLHKDASQADIARVIEQVRQGGSPISPMVARKVLSRLHRDDGSAAATASAKTTFPDEPALTPREAQVLQLIAKGFSYAEAGQHLGLSLATIQSHVRSIYGKLEVHSRGEAVFEAARRGLLDGWHA